MTISQDVLKAAKRDTTARSQPDPETLQGLVALANEARDLEAQKAALEEQLSDAQKRLQELLFKRLPDAMDTAGVLAITLPDGTHLESKPYYHANIAAGWEEKRRKMAFDWLIENGHEDLIKTEVALAFARGDFFKAVDLVGELRTKGLTPILNENVHFQTLTAWLKEQVEKHQTMPPLDIIGGTVGRVAKIKVKEI